MKKAILFLSIILFFGCKSEKQELTAEQIVDKAIEAAGGSKYENAQISFRFRDYEYESSRKNGDYSLKRSFRDSLGRNVEDELTNAEFTRKINDSVVQLSASLSGVYSNSVNSVHYFFQLPFGLNSEAVIKEKSGKDSIASKEYHKIKVTFRQEGGGTDYEDTYMYWIGTEDFLVDFLAYNYETNDGGVRFRKAINPRVINGIRVVDYENYKYSDKEIELSKLDSLYEAGKLEKVSEIINENVNISSTGN